jgi:hypothetical protein
MSAFGEGDGRICDARLMLLRPITERAARLTANEAADPSSAPEENSALIGGRNPSLLLVGWRIGSVSEVGS